MAKEEDAVKMASRKIDKFKSRFPLQIYTRTFLDGFGEKSSAPLTHRSVMRRGVFLVVAIHDNARSLTRAGWSRQTRAGLTE